MAALVQKGILPFVIYEHSLLYIYDIISVITQNYLPYTTWSKKSIICDVWANNSECPECYLPFMSKGSTTYSKLSVFLVSCQFTKTYLTNFVLSRFCWIQIFIQVYPYVDYAIPLCG